MVAHNSSDDLQRQMRQVRKDLDAHSEDMVEQARKQLDWRAFIAKHPFAIMGAAAAAGYLLAPRRVHLRCLDEKTIKSTVEQAMGRAQAAAAAPKSAGVLASLASMAMGLIVSEGVSLATRLVRNLLEGRSGTAASTFTSFSQPSAAANGAHTATNGEHP
jgi:hypothetical protein